MKKYLLTSVISLSLCIALIVHLYKTKDIEWIDAIVEKSTAALGIVPDMVTRKVERKTLEKKLNSDTAAITIIPEQQETVDSSSLAIDSVVADVSPVVIEKKKARFFNGEQTSKQEVAVVKEEFAKVDSIVTTPAVVTAPPKRKLFNTVIDQSQTTAKATEEKRMLFFKAEVNNAQRFGDDQEIVFRTSEPILLGEAKIPERIVFRAKTNVFDGRIHFIVKSIQDIKVKAENYKEQLPGMPIRAEFRLDESYFLADGFPVVFGVWL